MKPKIELLDVLLETNELLEKNDNISWQGLSAAEASMTLEITIKELKEKKSVDKQYLKMLFDSDGLIHESSKINNWETQFLDLNKRFDRLINKIK